jgi:hypothetical protein
LLIIRANIRCSIANPLNCLAETFNNYDQFQPQNLMVAYMHNGTTGVPQKKHPWEAVANPLNCLAETFNNYDQFQPQNLMVAYMHNGTTGVPQKKHPWEASSDEWADLSTQIYDI